MKLSEWAKRHGVSYRTAWKWFRKGTLPAQALQLPTGTILVLEAEGRARPPAGTAAISARVSVHEAGDDLERQVHRLQDDAAARGYRTVRVVSGVNDRRPRLERLLRERDDQVLLGEYTDRLTRFGFPYLELLLRGAGQAGRGGERGGPPPKHDLVEDMVAVISSFAARLYGLRGKRKAKTAVSILGGKGGEGLKRGRPKNEPHGAYLLPHAMNRGKAEKTLAVLLAYRKAAEESAALHLRNFSQTGTIHRLLDPTGVPRPLSDCYLWVCSHQVVDILTGHLEVLKERVRELILGSALPAERKQVLLAMNAMGLWLSRNVREVVLDGRTVEVAAEDRRLLCLFRRARRENRWPRMDRMAMHLDGKVARYEERREGKATHFPAWLHMATLEPGRRVRIPLRSNPYAESLPGTWRGFCQIGEEDGKVWIRRVKSLERRSYTPRTDRLALDLGLSPLIAPDRGDLLGRGFLTRLRADDAAIQAIQRKAQREGRRLREVRAYREAVRRLREFLRNAVNRLLNRGWSCTRPGSS